MDFKFGRCIHTVHAIKSPLTILDKRERVRIQELPKILLYYVSFSHETHRKSIVRTVTYGCCGFVKFVLLTYRHARVSASGLWTRRVPAVMCRLSIHRFFLNIGDTDNTGCTEIYSRIARYSLR